MDYRETIPTRLRAFALQTGVNCLFFGIISLFSWHLGLALFIITEFLTFVALANSTYESVVILDPKYFSGEVFQIKDRLRRLRKPVR